MRCARPASRRRRTSSSRPTGARSTPRPPGPSCLTPSQVRNPCHTLNIAVKDDGTLRVVWTYGVRWEPSPIAWASRWDSYLAMADTEVPALFCSLGHSLPAVLPSSTLLTLRSFSLRRPLVSLFSSLSLSTHVDISIATSRTPSHCSPMLTADPLVLDRQLGDHRALPVRHHRHHHRPHSQPRHRPLQQRGRGLRYFSSPLPPFPSRSPLSLSS